jgi:hypothetical protein
MRSVSSRKVPSTDGLSRDECGSCRVSGVFVGEALESFRFFSLVAVLWIVAGDEVVEVAALEGIFFEGEVFVSTEIVDPELVYPRLFGGGLRSKKRTSGLTPWA